MNKQLAGSILELAEEDKDLALDLMEASIRPRAEVFLAIRYADLSKLGLTVKQERDVKFLIAREVLNNG